MKAQMENCVEYTFITRRERGCDKAVYKCTLIKLEMAIFLITMLAHHVLCEQTSSDI